MRQVFQSNQPSIISEYFPHGANLNGCEFCVLPFVTILRLKSVIKISWKFYVSSSETIITYEVQSSFDHFSLKSR